MSRIASAPASADHPVRVEVRLTVNVKRVAQLLVLSLVGGLLLLPSSTFADGSTLAANELVPWVLLLDAGGDGVQDIDVGGRSIQVVRIPVSFPVTTFDEHGYVLKWTLPISFGFHELSAKDIVGGELSESLSTVTVMPGLEWTVRMPERGVVKPFVEVGVSSELSTSESVGLYSLGSRLLRPISRDDDDLRLGALLRFSGSSSDGALESGTIVTAELGLERMFEPRFSMGGEPISLGLYGLAHHNFTTVRLRELDLSETTLRRTALELGFSVGTVDQVKVLGITLPRLGISYRMSGEFTSWRINFGFPF